MLTTLLGLSGVLAQTGPYPEAVAGPPVVEVLHALAFPVLGGMLAVLLFHVVRPVDDDGHRVTWLDSPPRVLLAVVLAAFPGGVVGGIVSRWVADLTDGHWGTLEAVVFIAVTGVAGAWALHLAFRYENQPR